MLGFSYESFGSNGMGGAPGGGMPPDGGGGGGMPSGGQYGGSPPSPTIIIKWLEDIRFAEPQ